MKSRRLGRSGLEVSIVGIGCNNFGGRLDAAGSRAVIHAALDAGITLFDTADVYGERGGSERVMGEVLGARRQDIVLATKFANPMGERKQGGSRRYIMEAVEASLRRLRTDWIDLYQMHQPDPATPMEETLRALDDLVRQGKVRYIGCSNFAGWQLSDALWTSRLGQLEYFISAQNEYSLVERGIEAELVPAMEHHGVSLLPFYPLAGGLLSGKYLSDAQAQGRLTKFPAMAKRHMNERKRAIAQALNVYAQERGYNLLELSMSWLAGQGTVGSVIAGASTAEQVRANAASVRWQMSVDDLSAIDAITKA